MATSMYKTKDPCDKCGEMLYHTRVGGRVFCKTCWEYKDAFQVCEKPKDGDDE